MSRKRFGRRWFLGGAAVAIGLPALESLTRPARVARAASHAPAKRFLAYYVPNGIHMPAWTPSATGSGYDLPAILAPLSDVKNKVSVISGLANLLARPDGPGDHASGTGAFLTCAHPYKTEGADIKNGISADQVIANQIGGQTRIASLQLGIEGGAGVGGCDSGYSCAYARNISWASETQPLPKTVNPQVVFDQIFDGFDPSQSTEAKARTKAYRQSILDYVMEETASLETKLGAKDQLKLKEYLDGIRDLELRVQAASEPQCDIIDRPPSNLSFPEHVKMMSDLMVLAFQCDVTRVISFMLGNAGSGRNYDFIGASGGHHAISHHQSAPANYALLTTIGTWEIQQFAYLLAEMDKVQEEGGSTLLDNTAIFFSSEIEDGNAHRHTNLPVLLAGGAGGLPMGQHIKLPSSTPPVPIANLFLRIMSSLGVPDQKFGDSTGPLSV
jgi:hypothetical protein